MSADPMNSGRPKGSPNGARKCGEAGHTGPTLLDLIPGRTTPMAFTAVEQIACRTRTPDEDAAVQRAHAKYAARLDVDCPGWEWDDLDEMVGELAAEARTRRALAEPAP